MRVTAEPSASVTLLPEVPPEEAAWYACFSLEDVRNSVRRAFCSRLARMFVYVGYPRRPTAPTTIAIARHDRMVASARRAFGVARYFTQRSLCLSLLIVALTTQQGAWCWPASALRPCPEVPGLADDVGCGNRHERSTGEEDVGRSTGDGKRGSSRRDLQDVPGDACARRGELQAKTAVHGSERRGAEALQGEDRD